MKQVTRAHLTLCFSALASCIASAALCSAAFGQAFLYSRDSGSLREDAVPGEYFFRLGVEAINKQDYRYAITLYKIAASWAYKPAEYNLGVIFVKGEGGVPEDRPQGLAWLTLAAERNDKNYVAARDRVRSALTPDELSKADALAADLNQTYGDAHALPRAKQRWHEVRANATGSHVGFIGNLKVGAMDIPNNNNPTNQKGGFGKVGTGGGLQSAASMTGGNYTDGSISYRELRESDNPYDPKFDVGTVTVGEVVTVQKKETDNKPANSSEEAKKQ
jgi:hypothetical protein